MLSHGLQVRSHISYRDILEASDGVDAQRWVVLTSLLVRHVWVFGLEHDLVMHQVLVVVGHEPTHAAPRVAVGARTIKELLLCEVVHESVLDGDDSLECIDRREAIAGATLSLVLHVAHHSVLPPVDSSWQRLQVASCLFLLYFFFRGEHEIRRVL